MRLQRHGWVDDAMSVSHTPRHFRQQLSALAAALILIVCSSQQSRAQVTIQVNTTQQGVTNGQCSLQEAIYASELKSNKAVASTNPDTFYNTGCTAGTGNGDIIVLSPGAVYTFDHSWDADSHNIYGPTATPIIFSKIIIQGNGATLRWQGTFTPGNSRLFAIGKVDDPNLGSGTGDLTLLNVYIKDFHIKGGNGGDGGGGGLGAGGAIYNEGNLTVENSTFENNGAVGGRGRFGFQGGGGGLSGDGGSGCIRSAGGGGGSRGNGGNGAISSCSGSASGGGGGGTVLSGGQGTGVSISSSGGVGGFRCGGPGANAGDDADNAPCPGGGGGGAGGSDSSFCWLAGSCFNRGGDGEFGGGGGGGTQDGGNGEFGGGGGGGWYCVFFFGFNSSAGGPGGFGGGGGAGGDCERSTPGKGGYFGGRADDKNGGGGGALGGAIFNRGVLQVKNSTFFNNYVARGEGGGGSAANGADAGGAIFSMGKSLEVNDSTFSGNQSTGSGAAIVAFNAIVHVKTGPGFPFPPTVPVDVDIPIAFTLNNTVIANNGANECFFLGNGTINPEGAGNLIMQNGSGQFKPCPGVVTTSDPQLQPLQLNSPGNTPTMAILSSSPAVDKADPSTSLSKDQRDVPRPQPQGGASDIGAFEVKTTTTWNPADKGTSIDLSNGNLTFALNTDGYYGVRSVASASTGKKYWELKASTIVSPAFAIGEGIVNGSFPTNNVGYNLGSTLDGIGWYGDGRIILNDAVVDTIQGWQQNDVLSFALDLDSKKIWFRTNAGSWNNNPANDPATNTGGIDISSLAGGPYFPFGQGYSGRDTLTANFGGSPYTQSAPSGFSNW